MHFNASRFPVPLSHPCCWYSKKRADERRRRRSHAPFAVNVRKKTCAIGRDRAALELTKLACWWQRTCVGFFSPRCSHCLSLSLCVMRPTHIHTYKVYLSILLYAGMGFREGAFGLSHPWALAWPARPIGRTPGAGSQRVKLQECHRKKCEASILITIRSCYFSKNVPF